MTLLCQPLPDSVVNMFIGVIGVYRGLWVGLGLGWGYWGGDKIRGGYISIKVYQQIGYVVM